MADQPLQADDPDSNSADEESGAQQRREDEARTFINDLTGSGWKWNDDGLLCHPDDPDLNIWRHPYSHEILYSPKLVEQIKRDIDGKDAAGFAE